MSLHKLTAITAFTLAIAAAMSACSPSHDDGHDHDNHDSTGHSETATVYDLVEIALIDKLDGTLSHFCIDTDHQEGGANEGGINKGLQARTCHSYTGELAAGQTFAAPHFIDDVLYMPLHNVCASLEGFDVGAKISLSKCNSTQFQKFTFTGTGHISPIAAPDKCLTATSDTRSGKNSKHQIKNLKLEICGDDLAAYQNWYMRLSAD